MDKCRLCKINLADKKGSHIVPHFLLRRIDNLEGSKERGKELGFFIGEFTTLSYFGREVPPEKIDELYGEIPEEKLRDFKHPLIVDNLFCTSCEKRLAAVEEEYSKTINKHSQEVYDSGIKSELSFLFWASILWRLSVNNKNGVRLTKGEEETLRRILNRSLREKITDIDIENFRNSKDLKTMSYRLIRCPEYSLNNVTQLLFHPFFNKPYTLLIDEYILLFSFKSKYDEFNRNNFFGLKEDVFKAPMNSKISNEKVLALNTEKMAMIMANVKEKIAQIRFKHIELFLDLLHVELGGIGQKMPYEIKGQILSELSELIKRTNSNHIKSFKEFVEFIKTIK